MVDATVVTKPLLLVSDDRALVRLIRLECSELSLPLEVATALPEHTEDRTLLIDLDSISIADGLIIGEGQTVAGICRDVSQLPTEWQARFSHLLQRPCPTAQLRALLAHLCGRGEMPTIAPSESRVRTVTSAKDLSLAMLDDARLQCGEDVLRLSPTEAAIMRILIARRGEVVSREMLEEALRGDGKTDSNKIEVYLCFLRRKIERPLGLRLITTVRGKGYRLE